MFQWLAIFEHPTIIVILIGIFYQAKYLKNIKLFKNKVFFFILPIIFLLVVLKSKQEILIDNEKDPNWKKIFFGLFVAVFVCITIGYLLVIIFSLVVADSFLAEDFSVLAGFYLYITFLLLTCVLIFETVKKFFIYPNKTKITESESTKIKE